MDTLKIYNTSCETAVDDIVHAIDQDSIIDKAKLRSIVQSFVIGSTAAAIVMHGKLSRSIAVRGRGVRIYIDHNELTSFAIYPANGEIEHRVI